MDWLGRRENFKNLAFTKDTHKDSDSRGCWGTSQTKLVFRSEGHQRHTHTHHLGLLSVDRPRCGWNCLAGRARQLWHDTRERAVLRFQFLIFRFQLLQLLQGIELFGSLNPFLAEFVAKVVVSTKIILLVTGIKALRNDFRKSIWTVQTHLNLYCPNSKGQIAQDEFSELNFKFHHSPSVHPPFPQVSSPKLSFLFSQCLTQNSWPTPAQKSQFTILKSKRLKK